LEGKHSTQGRQQYDQDQTNPRREFNGNAELMKRKIPPQEATKITGLSCLLAWMSTGQGTSRMRTFIDSLETFIFPSLEDCCQAFDNVIQTNLNAIALAGFKSKRIDKLPGYVCLDNPNIYGAASNSLKLLPTRGRKFRATKYTLREKFGPFYTKEVQQKWAEFLGDMLDKDPRTYTGLKHSWYDGFEFLVRLALSGFKTGLTLFQTVNGMTFLSMLTRPNTTSVTNWIAGNPTLGAYRGLSDLGFNLVDSGFMRVAFVYVFNHLDKYMTPNDKAIMGFGSIFVEQVLCKVVRWDYRLRIGGADDLEVLAEEALKSGVTWAQGANQTDGRQFPFPLELDDKLMQESILVSISANKLNF
jgi:hypothetical protein